MADIFDRDGDGYIDYYEFVAALHPNKDAYKPLTDADKIEDEVTLAHLQLKSSNPGCGLIKRCLFAGYTSSGEVQVSKTIPGGANWCQQIPGKQISHLFESVMITCA